MVGEVAAADRSQAARAEIALNPAASQGDAGAALMLAAIAQATGNTEAARAALSRVGAGPLAAVAQLKLGMIAVSAGRDQESLAFFERAVYLDTYGAVTDSISFKTPSPRVQLTLLYSRLGRDLAAVRMAEDQEKPLISKAVRDALSSDAQKAQPEQSVVFEPPLELPRVKGASLRTIGELKQAAAAKTERDILAALVGAAERLGQYDKAIAIERLRIADAMRAEDKAAIEKSLAGMLAAERARQISAASILLIDHSNTTGSIYAEQVIGK